MRNTVFEGEKRKKNSEPGDHKEAKYYQSQKILSDTTELNINHEQ